MVSERPEEKLLAKLRKAMQGAEVPVVLERWMGEVEAQLVALRNLAYGTALVEEARVEWETLGLVGSHGTPSGVWFVDLTPEDLEKVRELIRRLAHAVEHG